MQLIKEDFVALNLKFENIDFSNGTLLITYAKSNKERLVPMEWGLVEILKKYFNVIHKIIPNGIYLFESNYKDGKKSFIGHPRSPQWARGNFSRIIKCAGISIYTPRGQRSICPHCLRHTFVDHAILKQNTNGVNSYSILPIISVYLGHENLTETQRYIHLTSDISDLIIQKTAQAYENIFPEIPK